MTMLQLDPLIPLETPRGKAMAHFVIDYGAEHFMEFVCFVDETGECRIYRNDQVRLQRNETARPTDLPVDPASRPAPSPHLEAASRSESWLR